MKPMLFGKYCLLERISVGGMAEVFRAKPFNAPDFSGFLALKRILPHLAEDEEFIMMFIDEAKLTVQLDHPNIVRIYELGQFQNSFYILMEFISGKDLLTLQKTVRKRRETIGVGVSCYIASRVAQGLDYAHRKSDADGNPLNIIHRDISPQNVLVDYLGNVKVIDFGIAKAAVQSTKTQVGVLKGKMGYMSPEQVSGEKLDWRSDVFAIGTVLWEMLTNRRLFNGDNEFETMQLVKGAVAEPPSSKNPDVPAEIDRIVMKALARDRDERYQSGAELAKDLDRWLNDHQVTAESLSRWMREVYAEDLEEEMSKRQDFATIQTPDDVRRLLVETAEPSPTAGESATGNGETVEKTEIWDAEILPGEEDLDPMEFAAQHTVVQAGGFDPSNLNRNAPRQPAAHPYQFEGNTSFPTGPAGPSASRSQQLAAREPLPAGSVGSSNEFQSAGTSRQPRPGPSSGLRYATMGLSVVVFMLLFGVLTSLVFYEPTSHLGAILIATPLDGAEILVDGKPLATSSPARIERLEPGEHLVEIRHPDFKTFQSTVRVAPGSVQPLEAQLERAGPVMGKFRVNAPVVGGGEIWINGENKGAEVFGKTLEAPVGPQLVEVNVEGYKPWHEFVEVRDEGVVEVRPDLERIGLELEVVGEAGSVVRFDNERVGVVPVTLERVDPRKLHKLDLTLRQGGVSRFRTFLGLPGLLRARFDASFDNPTFELGEDEYGFITLSTGDDWWNVWIDGKEVGLKTPVTVEEKLPLARGKHVISLRRGFEKHEIPIEVRGGETVVLRQELPFEW